MIRRLLGYFCFFVLWIYTGVYTPSGLRKGLTPEDALDAMRRGYWIPLGIVLLTFPFILIGSVFALLSGLLSLLGDLWQDHDPLAFTARCIMHPTRWINAAGTKLHKRLAADVQPLPEKEGD